MGDFYDNILEQKGFHKIGSLSYRLQLSIWWHPEQKIELILLSVSSRILIKGNKPYYLKSISDQGETWIRDIGPLHNYLETHFPELHLSFSYFRDITKTLAGTRIRRKLSAETPTINIPSVEQIASLQQSEMSSSQNLSSMENFLKLDSGSSSFLKSYLNSQTRELKQQVKKSREQIAKEKTRLSLFQNLQKEYEHKGSAACLVFSLISNIQVSTSQYDFNDAIDNIVKELADAHRYQVTQKLCGGRLNIHVSEAEEPVVVWIEEWLGGGLSPRQMERFFPEFSCVDKEFEKHRMVTPNEDIEVENSIKDSKKLFGARVVSTLFNRLDRPNKFDDDLANLSKNVLPIKIGLAMNDQRVTNSPIFLPLAKTQHGYVSGSTGSGKSFLGRVMMEEATMHSGLNILILDPRNQAAGLLVPEDREKILSRYPDFGIKASSSRGFKFKYYAPEQTFGEKLPSDLSQLGKGKSIISFKWLNELQRCELFKQIIDAVFASFSEESDHLKLAMFVDESQLFTKKRVADNAKAAALQAEIALDRFVRESRKLGCTVFIMSQSIKDFSHDSASVRQNTNTKIFLRNSDREVDYAGDFISDGRQIINLSPGTAIIHNSEWGIVKVKVRPPFSKVWEYSAEDTRRVVSGSEIFNSSNLDPSGEAQELLSLVKTNYSSTGKGINISEAGKRIGISSKRKLLQLIDKLERAGLVKTYKLSERGQPRIIEPI